MASGNFCSAKYWLWFSDLISYSTFLFMFKVIFSDEKKFSLDSPNRFDSYWHDIRKEQRYFSKQNFGGGSVMVWGTFTAFSTLLPTFTSSKMSSKEYQKVLNTNLLPFFKNRRRSLIYQQENASIHVSVKNKVWFAHHKINVQDWPACFVDCNPIENVCGILVRKIYANKLNYATADELKSAILTAWNSLEKKTFSRLTSSMKNRIFKLIKKKTVLQLIFKLSLLLCFNILVINIVIHVRLLKFIFVPVNIL